MVINKGTEEIEQYRKILTRYKFFNNQKIPIFGLEETIDRLMKHIKGAAGNYGTEKRILLLHGPVGSSKSTICRLLKRGLEEYSKTDEGAWYSYKWVNLPTGPEGIYVSETDECAMHEEPLKLIPVDARKVVLEELNKIHMELTPEKDRASQYSLVVDHDLNPRCKLFMNLLLKKYNGDWQKVVENHIRVIRKVYDETESTGDINFAKISQFGSDSDPRAFSFDGELCVGNRGVVEFIEMLKLDQAFLYDLLGASQERCIKPKKFSQIPVDMAIIGHTNQPEF